MKLLIITQKVDRNDPILGFFHRWIVEFSKHCESLVVICLEKGEYDLPKNVKVLSLGKEEGRSKAEYLSRFYRYIWTERKNYDSVFVHMNPEYLALGGLFWRMLGRKIALWYVHKQSNLKLWISTKFANVIFTSAPESFSLRSNKVRYVGHGIDTDRFTYSTRNFSEPISVAHVGRVTRIKNIYMIIEGLSFLLKKGVQVQSLSFVGEPITADDRKYKLELEELAKRLDVGSYVVWKGSMPNSELPEFYKEITLSINAAPDGGMDKAVLESLATGCPAFATNKAFEGVYRDQLDKFFYNDALDLSDKISSFIRDPHKELLSEQLSKKVTAEYSVSALVDKVINELNT